MYDKCLLAQISEKIIINSILILGLIERSFYLSILFIYFIEPLAFCIWNIWSIIWNRKTSHKGGFFQFQITWVLTIGIIHQFLKAELFIWRHKEEEHMSWEKTKNSRSVHFYEIYSLILFFAFCCFFDKEMLFLRLSWYFF